MALAVSVCSDLLQEQLMKVCLRVTEVSAASIGMATRCIQCPSPELLQPERDDSNDEDGMPITLRLVAAVTAQCHKLLVRESLAHHLYECQL